MKVLPALGLALLGFCFLGAAPRVPFDPHSPLSQGGDSHGPCVPAPLGGAHPSLSGEVRQRMALALRNSSLAEWQRKLMMEIAREGGAGSVRDWHGTSSSAEGTWSPWAANLDSLPSVRVEPTAIYDPVRDRMVVFGGGAAGGYLNEVWVLSLAGSPAWTRLAPTGTAPNPRYADTAIYDPVRDRMIIFGGYGSDGIGGNSSFNDVWALSLAEGPAWTQLTPAGLPPSPRFEHTAVYDPVHDRMLVCGGADDAGFLNDVWELSLGTPEWVQLTPVGTPPSARYAHSAIYDPVRNQMLVFGGYYFDGDGDHNLNDLWALSLTGSPAWTQLAPGGGTPSERVAHRAIYEPANDRMVVFGGRVFNSSFNNEVWALSLAGSPVWSLLTPDETPPSARGGHSAIFDPVRERMVVFGGLGDLGPLSDSWALSLGGTPAWAMLTSSGTGGGGPPSNRYVHTAIYDPLRDRMVVFGGVDGDWVNDVWALSLGGGSGWVQLTPAGTPPEERGAHTAIYDPIRDRMLIFGGAGDSGYLNDVWALSLGGSPVWMQLTPGGVPPSARNWHTAIYDPIRDRMVIFGGTYYDFVSTTESYFNDVWALSLGGSPTWTQITPAGAPPEGRSEHTAIYDPVRDRMLVFGGFNHDDIGNQYLFNDVWEMSLSGSPTWTELAPGGTRPSQRCANAAIYDLARDRMVLFGGYDGNLLNDVWALSLTGNPMWTQRTPAGTPPSARQRSTAIYDPARGRMVVFGGLDSDYRGDLWELQWGTVTGVSSQAEESVLRLTPAYPNPSRSDVSIGFTLPHSSEASVRVYDVSGRLVATIANGILPAGYHLLHWDRRLPSGVLAPSGSYFYELRANGEKVARRLVVAR